MFKKILVHFVRLTLRVYLGWGIYSLWSKVHRVLFDRKWDNIELADLHSFSEVAKQMRVFKWKRDGLSELWDAVCTPQKVQQVGWGDSPHGNDCDEAAIWVTNVINKNLRSFELAHDVLHVGFFTVTWFEPDKMSFSGHNVCLLEVPDGFMYVDYGMPSIVLPTKSDIANLVAKDYAGWNSTGHGTQQHEVVLWCESNKDLKVLDVGK